MITSNKEKYLITHQSKDIYLIHILAFTNAKQLKNKFHYDFFQMLKSYHNPVFMRYANVLKTVFHTCYSIKHLQKPLLF